MERSRGGTIRLCFALWLAVLTSACASQTVNPPPPIPGIAAPPPAIGESTINVRARVDYAAMAAAANGAVPAEFLDLSGADIGRGVTFRLTGTRSDISVARSGNQVRFASAVHVAGVLDSRCVLLTHCQGTLDVDGNVWGSAQPTINPDWTLNLKPAGGFVINEADLGVSLFPKAVSVKAPLTRVLQSPFNDFIAQINGKVSDSLALKSMAASAWSQLSQPIAISASPPVWLEVNPSRVLTEQPTITDQGVELGAALVARPELIVGDRPADRDPGPLPNLTLVNQVPDQFSLYLPVSLSYDEATQLAGQFLIGKQLAGGPGVQVSIVHVSIFGNGDEVGVKIAFHATALDGGWRPDGVLYFLGTPVYDLDNGYIAVENLHFDVKTHDTILAVAAWLAHQELVDDLQSRLHFDIRTQVEARRHDLDAAINNTQLNPHISLTGQVTSLAPSRVYLTPDALHVNVVALGALEVLAH